MVKYLSLNVVFVGMLFVVAACGAHAAVDFQTQVQPIFTANCVGCHSGGSPAAGMNLSSGSAYANLVNVKATTFSGTRVIPSDPTNSVLVKNMLHRVNLSVADQTTIKTWISEGATQSAASSGPAITSAASAVPNPVQAGQSTMLSVAASNATTFTWDFGDTSAGSGTSVQHTYTNPGTYQAKVTVANAQGASVSSSVSVVVGAGSVVTLPIAKLSGAISFTAQGKDSATLTGTIPGLPAGFSPLNKVVTVNIGGVTEQYTLDAKGVAKTGLNGSKDTFSLKVKLVKGVFNGGDAQFTAVFKGGNFSQAWAADELTSTAALKNSPLNFPVTVTLNGVTYSATRQVSATTKVGKGGAFK